MLKELKQNFYRIWLIAHVALVGLAFAVAAQLPILSGAEPLSSSATVRPFLRTAACALVRPRAVVGRGI